MFLGLVGAALGLALLGRAHERAMARLLGDSDSPIGPNGRRSEFSRGGAAV